MNEDKLGRAASGGKVRDSFYKRDPARARRGMRGLTLEEKAIYQEIIDLTYEFEQAPVDEPRRLAFLCECSVRVFKRVRDSLLEKGRLKLRDGRLVDETSLDMLAARAAEREKSVNDKSTGAGRPVSKDRKTGEFATLIRRRFAESLTNQSEFHRPIVNENKAKFSQEVESESELPYLDSKQDDDLTGPVAGAIDGGDLPCFGVLPPLSPDSPLLAANVAPIGPITTNDPAEIHAILIAAAGPRLVVGDALQGSRGHLARAIVQGCHPELDMLPVVAARSHGPGGPITTWSYFIDAWMESRDRRTGRSKRSRRAS